MDCAICLNNIENKKVKFICGHKFCLSCIYEDILKYKIIKNNKNFIKCCLCCKLINLNKIHYGLKKIIRKYF